MVTSPQENEDFQMATAVLTEWLAGNDVGPVIEAYSKDRHDAQEMILGGMVPLAGNMLLLLAEAKNVSAKEILRELGQYLAERRSGDPPVL
jgi:hypothetical protein